MRFDYVEHIEQVFDQVRAKEESEARQQRGLRDEEDERGARVLKFRLPRARKARQFQGGGLAA